MLLLDASPFDLGEYLLKNILPSLATGGIVIYFLKERIKAMETQVSSLKAQIESQQGILNTTKTYFEIIDTKKIKEYVELMEGSAQLKVEKKIEELEAIMREKEAKIIDLESKQVNSGQVDQELLETKEQLAALQIEKQNTLTTIVSASNSLSPLTLAEKIIVIKALKEHLDNWAHTHESMYADGKFYASNHFVLRALRELKTAFPQNVQRYEYSTAEINYQVIENYVRPLGLGTPVACA